MNIAVLAIIVSLLRDRKVSDPLKVCIDTRINNQEYIEYALNNEYIRISTPIENIETSTLKNIKLALKESGLKQVGEKQEIIQRLKEKGNTEIIGNIFKNFSYKITKKGEELLKNKEYALLYYKYEFDFLFPYISLYQIQDKVEKENKDFITACKELYHLNKNKRNGSETLIEKYEFKFYDFFKLDKTEIEKLKPREKNANFLNNLSETDGKKLNKMTKDIKSNLYENFGIRDNKKRSFMKKIINFLRGI